MAFADAFSAENVQRVMSDPRMVMGLQMLQQSGFQQGNPGFGARLGQAGIGAMQQIAQQQHSQQLQAYRQQMIQQAEQQRAFQMQQAQQKADEQQRQRQALQDPNFQSGLGGIAKTLASLGMPLDDVLKAQSSYQLQQHRQAQLQQQSQQFDMRQAHQGSGQAQGPRMPTQRQVLDQPLGNGMMQRHVLDPQTGEYQPYGEPFAQFSPGRGKSAKSVKADPLEAIVQHATGGTPAEDGLGSLPGGAPLANYAPAPQGADLLMRSSANPKAAREGMRIPGQPKIATPMTKAEYDALPVGAMYQDPVSGKVAAKKAR